MRKNSEQAQKKNELNDYYANSIYRNKNHDNSKFVYVLWGIFFILVMILLVLKGTNDKQEVISNSEESNSLIEVQIESVIENK